ncbi:MAG: metal ABC transporter ATP-binding protein [Treponema sp.]|jgi:zinc transport system ATP-binding protein|nr:metal ABC transporter ATP-binding protein [Treponema sp.]
MTHNNEQNGIAVRFDSVSFSYGDIAAGGGVKVLEEACFHIHRGEFAAMVGPNGSGKTTVLKLLFGLETPVSGNIEIFGKACGSKKNKSNLAYVPQQMPVDYMFPITVRNIVRMGLLRPFKRYAGSVRENDAVTDAMEITGISDLGARSYRSLSGGQRRRALVARALAANPDLLVLDEPTANMDHESETRLYETLGSCKGRITILIVTHDTEFVTSLTDRVLCLGDSYKVVQHRTKEDASVCRGNAISGRQARVLHGEIIPADDCCKG